MSESLVALGYHDTDRTEALDSALSEAKLLASIAPGDSVYLRVNSNSGDPYPYSTSPELIIAVGERLRDLGVTDIRIGDRSFWGDPDTKGNLKRNGIAAAAQTLGVSATVFDNNVSWVELDATKLPTWKAPVRIPKLVRSASHLINLACVKTHFISHVTMCLKLCLGLIDADDRRRAGNLDVHIQSRLWAQIAEINGQLGPVLNILDGYEAVVSGGPTVNDTPPGAPNGWQPQTAHPKTIIASADPIAADVVGAALLRRFAPTFEEVQRRSPWELPQVQTAMSFGGIGISTTADLHMVGTTVPNLDNLKVDLGL